jgi:uncharacterized membrane protein (UPF0127 family)
MKYLRLVVVGALIGLGISTFIKVYSSVPKACNVPYRHDTTISIGSNSISTEVAKTDDQKDKGLGGRDCIGTDQGMLFIFDKPATYPFWMKDMKFPIDVVWLNSDHNVVTVKSNVSPASYPETFQNSAPAQYVLELKAGQAKALEINNKTNLSFDLAN